MTSPKIAVIADIHHGDDIMTKKSSAALALLKRFAAFVREEKPDLVLDLGDRISDRDRTHDLALEREVARVFQEIEAPRFHLCGNHDRDFLSVADNEEMLGRRLRHQAVDLGSWTLLLWHADTHIHRRPDRSHFALADGDLEWLAGQLVGATKPTVIASHVPLSGQSQRSNYYFDANPGIATYPELDAIQEVLRSAQVPVVSLAGHVHWNSLTFVDGIPHVTLQSLTETFATGGEPAASWAMLELSDEVTWSAFGVQRFGFTIDAAQAGQRWPKPHPPFKPGSKPGQEPSAATR